MYLHTVTFKRKVFQTFLKTVRKESRVQKNHGLQVQNIQTALEGVCRTQESGLGGHMVCLPDVDSWSFSLFLFFFLPWKEMDTRSRQRLGCDHRHEGTQRYKRQTGNKETEVPHSHSLIDHLHLETARERNSYLFVTFDSPASYFTIKTDNGSGLPRTHYDSDVLGL